MKFNSIGICVAYTLVDIQNIKSQIMVTVLINIVLFIAYAIQYYLF